MENILLRSFEEMFKAIASISSVSTEVWFIVFPPALYFIFKLLWMDHIQDAYISGIRTVLLEIISPQNVEKSPKVMETFFDGLSGTDKGPTTVENFVQGFLPPVFSLEMMGNGDGNSHLCIRTPVSFRNLVEAYLYAQYPDVEIIELPDYTEDIPKGIPNKEWDLWGADFEFVRPDAYPIKTYHFFEEDITGKMIDPIAGLIETIGKLPPGQKIWFQIIISPLGPTFFNTGKELLQELVGRSTKEKSTSMFGSFFSALSEVIASIPSAFFGPVDFASSTPEKQEKKDFLEFQLTPIEKEVIRALESNIGRSVFSTRIRLLYVGKRKGFDRSFVSSFIGGIRQFNDSNHNSFKPNEPSKTYANYLFINSRLRFRQRRLLRRYKFRDPSPVSSMMVLSTAELATIFHIPDMAVTAPALSRVAAKRSSAPQNLPIQP